MLSENPSDNDMSAYALNNNELARELNGPLGREITRRTDGLIVVEMISGNASRVHLKGLASCEAAELEFYRYEDGTLDVCMNRDITRNMIAEIGNLDGFHIGTFAKYHPAFYKVAHQVIVEYSSPSTGILLDFEDPLFPGTGITTSERTILDNWRPKHDPGFPVRNGITGVESELTGLVMKNLVEPYSARLTKIVTGGLNGADYNRIHLNRDVFAELLTNGNPGAAALAALMRYPQDGCILQHPGQVASEIKGRLEDAGLSPSSWKKVAGAPQERMVEIWNVAAEVGLNYRPTDRMRHIDRALAMFFNSLGNDALPSQGYITAAMTLYWSTEPSDLDNIQNRDRLQQMMALLLADEWQGSQAVAEDLDTVADIREFVLESASRPNSRTWAGLRKASDRWWEEENYWQDWLELGRSATKMGGIHHWNSIIRGVGIGPYKFIALTNSSQLLEEGQRQKHCVYDYRMHCVNHLSRIFSVYEGDRCVATTALEYDYNRGWETAETYGKRNADVEDELLEAAEKLGNLYQELWAECGKHKAHTAWIAAVEPTIRNAA